MLRRPAHVGSGGGAPARACSWGCNAPALAHLRWPRLPISSPTVTPASIADFHVTDFTLAPPSPRPPPRGPPPCTSPPAIRSSQISVAGDLPPPLPPLRRRPSHRKKGVVRIFCADKPAAGTALHTLPSLLTAMLLN